MSEKSLKELRAEREKAIADEQENLQVADPTREVIEPEETKEEDLKNVKVDTGEEGYEISADALKKDPYTPGASMGHLEKFATEEMDKKVEEARKEREAYELKKKQEAELAQIEAKKGSEFADNVVEEEETIENEESKMDLSSIKIKKPKDITKAFTKMMNKRRETVFTTKVVLPRSGYTANVRGMSSPEIRNYSRTASNLDSYGYLKYKYQELYKRITETSLGEMDFDTFLKRTALMEYEILNHGLFSSTFPDKSQYPFSCPKCEAKDTFIYYNKDFIDYQEDDEEKKEAILEDLRQVLKGQLDPIKLFEEAATANYIRRYLKHSKIIVELRHPTLYDHLNDVTKNLTEQMIDENEEIVNILPFIHKVYFPTEETIDDERPEYFALDEVPLMIQALNTLDTEDDASLSQAISDEILSKYRIKFSIKPPACRLCGFKPDKEYIDSFDSMLFTMHQILSVRK